MRVDLQKISEWVKPHSRVLDLACGDGTLLEHLQNHKNVTGYGLEIDPQHIAQCIDKGVNVIQTDLDAGLSDFDENSFDYVVMTQSLQAMRYPAQLLNEMLRVGQQGIVSFPNFGHWKCRLDFILKGRMPMTTSLPNSWHDTPNIHLCTLQDFEDLCKEQHIKILQYTVGNAKHEAKLSIRLLPNLLSEVAIYHFTKQNTT